jgi:hypothetical protein
MCKPGETEHVLVSIPEDLSSDGYCKVKYVKIDKCIAPIVEALQRSLIYTRASCCGHGKGNGKILLQDGRFLIIAKKEPKMTVSRTRYWAEFLKACSGDLRGLVHEIVKEAGGEVVEDREVKG